MMQKLEKKIHQRQPFRRRELNAARLLSAIRRRNSGRARERARENESQHVIFTRQKQRTDEVKRFVDCLTSLVLKIKIRSSDF